jgi:hypothetical protein
LPERLGQRAHLAHARDHRGERFFGDAQPVDHRLGQSGFLGGGDVLRVGGENGGRVLFELRGDFVEHLVEPRGGQRGQGAGEVGFSGLSIRRRMAASGPPSVTDER